MRRPRDRYGRPLPAGSADALGPREPFRSDRDALNRGIAQFNEGRFFEAHECFEFLWKSDDFVERDRRFWKGLAQVAVGCCHVQRGNREGAVAVLERALALLADHRSPHLGLDTRALLDGTGRLVRSLRRDGITPGLEFPWLGGEVGRT